MALHRLTRITIGVPNVAETAGYYGEFGLTEGGAESAATGAGGPARAAPARAAPARAAPARLASATSAPAMAASSCGWWPRPGAGWSSCGSARTTRTTSSGSPPRWPGWG